MMWNCILNRNCVLNSYIYYMKYDKEIQVEVQKMQSKYRVTVNGLNSNNIRK